MPKVALRPIDAFESTIRQNYEKVKGGRTYAEIGKVIGRTAKTACTRYHDPLSMTLAELFLLCKHEQLSPADFVGGELRLQGVNHDGKFNEKYQETYQGRQGAENESGGCMAESQCRAPGRAQKTA